MSNYKCAVGLRRPVPSPQCAYYILTVYTEMTYSPVHLCRFLVAYNQVCLHLQRDYGDKRVFSERRRNDSYAEEEPEWFSGGPTSQSETIELIGFDDKILEDDKRKTKRSRKRTESAKEGTSICNYSNKTNVVGFVLVN